MLGGIFKAVTSPLGACISAGAALAASAALLYVTIDGAAVQRELRGQVTTITARATKYEKAYGQCRLNRQTLQTAVDGQNAAIERVRAEGEMRTAAAERALAAERERGARARGQAATILAETITETDELAQCRLADQYLIRGAGDAE